MEGVSQREEVEYSSVLSLSALTDSSRESLVKIVMGTKLTKQDHSRLCQSP